MRRSALFALLVLTGLNLLNYLDRNILATVEESVKQSLLLSDRQIGLLATAFVIVLMAASPIFGLLGDNYSRTKVTALGVAIWSLATVMSGLAHGFAFLFVFRMAVGIGEAAYGTITPGLLADYYPPSQRGRVFSIFYVAIPVGSALGYVLGGLMNGAYGWRASFFLAGAPGMLLAVLALFLMDPQRGGQEQGDDGEVHGHGALGMSLWKAYGMLMRNRLYTRAVLGYAAYTFAIAGLAFWMPAFLTRVRHMGVSEAPVVFGQVILVSGLVGTLAGGFAGDYFAQYSKHAYMWLTGLTAIAAVPFCVVALTSPQRSVFIIASLITATLAFASTGPVNTIIVNSVSPTMRATAVAASTITIHLLGDAISPFIIGQLSDLYSLARAVLLVPAALLVAGLIWTVTAWQDERRGVLV